MKCRLQQCHWNYARECKAEKPCRDEGGNPTEPRHPPNPRAMSTLATLLTLAGPPQKKSAKKERRKDGSPTLRIWE